MNNSSILTDFEYRKLTGNNGEYEIINPYIICDYDCKYCFCRKIRESVQNENKNDLFHRSITCNKQFPRLLGESIDSKKVYIGTAVDPYPLCEPEYLVTHNILKACVNLRKEIVIATKSPLIYRDIEYITSCPESLVFISLASLKSNWFNLYEPKAPHVKKRTSVIKDLSDNGVQVAIFVAPIIPNINDDFESLFNILDICIDAGAKLFVVSMAVPTDILCYRLTADWEKSMMSIFEKLSQRAPYIKDVSNYTNKKLGLIGLSSLLFLDDNRAFAVLQDKHP